MKQNGDIPLVPPSPELRPPYNSISRHPSALGHSVSLSLGSSDPSSQSTLPPQPVVLPRIRAAVIHTIFAARRLKDFITPDEVLGLEQWSGLNTLIGLSLLADVSARHTHKYLSIPTVTLFSSGCHRRCPRCRGLCSKVYAYKRKPYFDNLSQSASNLLSLSTKLTVLSSNIKSKRKHSSSPSNLQSRTSTLSSPHITTRFSAISRSTLRRILLPSVPVFMVGVLLFANSQPVIPRSLVLTRRRW